MATSVLPVRIRCHKREVQDGRFAERRCEGPMVVFHCHLLHAAPLIGRTVQPPRLASGSSPTCVSRSTKQPYRSHRPRSAGSSGVLAMVPRRTMLQRRSSGDHLQRGGSHGHTHLRRRQRRDAMEVILLYGFCSSGRRAGRRLTLDRLPAWIQVPFPIRRDSTSHRCRLDRCRGRRLPA
jgi:hypothetical protein